MDSRQTAEIDARVARSLQAEEILRRRQSRSEASGGIPRQAVGRARNVMQLHQLPDGVFVAEQEPDEHTTRHNGLSFVVQVAEQPHEGRPVALRVFQGGGHRVDAGNVARPFGFGRRGRNGANTRQIEGNSNTFVLQEASRLPPDNKLCAVCQMDFVDGDVLRALPCLHLFHSECVDQWLATNRNCPTCRDAQADITDMEGRAEGLLRAQASVTPPPQRRLSPFVVS